MSGDIEVREFGELSKARDWRQMLRDLADELTAGGGLSDRTISKYTRSLVWFGEWCIAADVVPFPASVDTIRMFVAELFDSEYSANSIGVYLAAIRWLHRRTGAPDPTADEQLRLTVAEARKRLGTDSAFDNQRRALSLSELGALLGAIDKGDLRAHRDRALLAVGWFTGLRRGELVSIDARHVTWDGGDLLIRRKPAKHDKRAKFFGVPLREDSAVCGARLMRRWLRESGTVEGPVFVAIDRHGSMGGRLADRDVHRILLRRARVADLADLADLGAHSLRHGVITELARVGVADGDISDFIGHASVETTRRYMEAVAALSERNPLRRLRSL